MKIGVDFDDVMVHTMRGFVRLWNKASSGPHIVYEEIDDWNLAKRLGVTEKTIHGYFNAIDYSEVKQVPDAAIGINDLVDDGHEVRILSSNPRQVAIRNWLDTHGLREVALVAGLEDKVKYAKLYDYDIIVDDKPETLRDAAVLGVHTIRFLTPWNNGMFVDDKSETHTEKFDGIYSAVNWAAILRIVRTIGYKLSLPAPFNDTLDEPIITNAKGAKQSDIGARYDLLPALAVKMVAQVLQRGEQKYGLDNWRGLSVEECHNHTLGHAIAFNRSNTIEDLAHTACRALMTLELALVEEKKVIKPGDFRIEEE